METIPQYLTHLASESPTPGGGSATTIVAAAGASLVAMVARICAASPKYASQSKSALALAAKADQLREDLLRGRPRDEAAFARVMLATAMPKGTDVEKTRRRDALERALCEAAAEPLRSAQCALAVLRLAATALEIPNKNLASDIGCAAEFASAAIAACAYNVKINHRFMHDAQTIDGQATALARCEREAAALLAGVRRAVRDLIEA
ncbi:MAG: cyclodeaminase/cyclohydrolase family protein [Candidatus Baltobacteraceae bacterium]